MNQNATVNANLILAGAQTFTTAAGKTLAIGGNITATGAGTGSLTLAGAGTVTLTGTSSYGGATTVSGGVLNYDTGCAKQFLGTASTLAVANGAVNVGGFVGLNRFDVNGNGAVNVTGGTLTTQGAKCNGSQVLVGSGSYGILNVSSGAVNISGNVGGNGPEDGRIDIGQDGTGLLRIAGGIMSVGNGIFLSGNNGPGNSELTITGGTLNHGGDNRSAEGWFYVAARGGLSVVNVAGGLIDNNQNQCIIANSGGTAGADTGIINLNSGTLVTREFTQPGSGNMAIINFNGGTLKVGAGSSTTAFTPTSFQATSSFMTYINGAFGAYAGGAVIDTFGNNTTIPNALLAPTGSGVSAIAVGSGGSGYIGAPYRDDQRFRNHAVRHDDKRFEDNCDDQHDGRRCRPDRFRDRHRSRLGRDRRHA